MNDNEKEYNDFMHELSKAAALYLAHFQMIHGRVPNESEVDSYTDGVMFTLAMGGMSEDAAAYIAAKLQDAMMQSIRMYLETHNNESPEYDKWLREG